MTDLLVEKCRQLAAKLWRVDVSIVSCNHFPEDGGWACVRSGLIVQRSSSLEALAADLSEAIEREQP